MTYEKTELKAAPYPDMRVSKSAADSGGMFDSKDAIIANEIPRDSIVQVSNNCQESPVVKRIAVG